MSQLKNNRPPLFLAGASATGKSEVALLLAERVGGEIISVDSMQVYRGLDIGTAKPTPAERQRVPHHLIDVVGLTEPFDAAQFVRLAHAAVAEIQARGKVPIFCGGTGLYFKAFLEGLGEAPPADAAVRAGLETTPLQILLDELQQCDPVAYEKIDRQNPRRVVRALEVIRLTGKPFSAQRTGWSPPETAFNPQLPTIWSLARTVGDLQARMNTRVDRMFQQGLVAEVSHLLTQGLAENKTAMQAIGYRQVVEQLRGEKSLSETIALVKIRTRQFTKRQLTWFRRQPQVKWLECRAQEPPEAVAARLSAAIEI